MQLSSAVNGRTSPLSKRIAILSQLLPLSVFKETVPTTETIRMTKYVAFLRGINVGGKKLIKMDALGRAFQSLGFENVKTFIQSGNVFFDNAETDLDVL